MTRTVETETSQVSIPNIFCQDEIVHKCHLIDCIHNFCEIEIILKFLFKLEVTDVTVNIFTFSVIYQLVAENQPVTVILLLLMLLLLL